MADSGTVAFSVVDGSVKIEGQIHWAKNGSNVDFYAQLTKAYSSANRSKFVGNAQERMRLSVDGTWSARVLVAGARSAGQGASGSGWIENNDFAGAKTATVTKAEKNTAYALVVEAYGNGTNTASYSLAVQFKLPIWLNDNGSLKQVEKVYYNDGGTIKECAVFFNDNGTIKEIK